LELWKIINQSLNQINKTMENEKIEIENKIVKFNIGGMKFTSTYETLKSLGENYLTSLLDRENEKEFSILRDENGYIVNHFL
jgi:hypothetical protein